jgi:hypothetical protein
MPAARARAAPLPFPPPWQCCVESTLGMQKGATSTRDQIARASSSTASRRIAGSSAASS